MKSESKNAALSSMVEKVEVHVKERRYGINRRNSVKFAAR